MNQPDPDPQHDDPDARDAPVAPADDGFYRGSFFGRRKGHTLKLHQAELFETLLPRLSFDIKAKAPADLRTLFTPDVEAVRVEIGFGSGEHLVSEALAFPHVGFIGCEPYINGMAKILTEIEDNGVSNIRLYAGDAAELLAWAPAGSFTRIDLIHPDPWPKRRHWKRRFVQEATLAEMARVLVPAGEFRFVHDIPDYVAWTLWHLMRSPDFTWTAERADDWRLPWPNYTMTRYGRKATREGRKAAYIISRKMT